MLRAFKRSAIGKSALYGRNTLLDALYWRASRAEFLARLGECRQLADALDLVWDYRGWGFYRRIRPDQHREEIGGLLARVSALEPQVIVEIGTRNGGTLCLWAQASPTLSRLVSIDLPDGIHGGGYPIQRAKLYQLFVANRPRCALHLVRADSQQAATRDQLMRLIEGRPIDFLFIDGDHRFDGVQRDYELYAPLVRAGGLIAFHDIRPNAKDPTIQVYQLWERLKQTNAHTEELLHQPYSGRYGIGILHKTD